MKLALLAAFSILACTAANAQSPRVLYTWKGTGNVQGWTQKFGDNSALPTNDADGELTITEIGADGAGWAVGDDGNVLSEGGKSIGGLDLTGLSAVEFDLGHSGPNPVTVQFFVQATPAFIFKSLGPDQDIAPGDVKTYTAPLDGLSPEGIALIKVIGINVRDHVFAGGNLTWTLREVRSAGTPLASRDFATHEPGSSDGARQGAYVNFDNNSVQGNDGGQNQSGLAVNDEAPPPGNTGSLEWSDLSTGDGGAIGWGNGTIFNGNSFNERPTDMSNYQEIVLRIAATNVTPNAVTSVTVGYFLQTGNFNFHTVCPKQVLPADGEFHELEFLIRNIPDLDFVVAHSLDLQSHPAGDLIIDVDFVRAQAAQINERNINDISDGCEPGIFHRGDPNTSGTTDISDGITIFGFLFLGDPVTLSCKESADANNDGTIDISDGIFLLNWLFVGGSEPAAPGPTSKPCGFDPDPPGSQGDLGCESYSCN